MILGAALLRLDGRWPVAVLGTSFAVWAAGEQAIRFLSWRARHVRSHVRGRDAGSVFVVVAGIAVGALGCVVAAEARLAPAPVPQVSFFVGIALAWAGIVLRWSAVRTLGVYFTITVTVAECQPSISAGPYRRLRHPAYTGLLLTMAGFGVALGDIAALSIGMCATAGGLAYRIRVEERALATTFGTTWEAFARRRARLVPGIW